eukprot:Lankesteria_metandrocarpae@DN6510_c0_g1_i1.p1
MRTAAFVAQKVLVEGVNIADVDPFEFPLTTLVFRGALDPSEVWGRMMCRLSVSNFVDHLRHIPLPGENVVILDPVHLGVAKCELDSVPRGPSFVEDIPGQEVLAGAEMVIKWKWIAPKDT